MSSRERRPEGSPTRADLLQCGRSAFVDVAIAHAMFRRASQAGHGTRLSLQDNMIFQHEELADWIRV